jgi:hypothetical protein
MKSKILVFNAGFSSLNFCLAFFILVFLVGCASPENGVEVVLSPTNVVTETPVPPTETMTPTATPAYHEMTNVEKLARSQAFVEEANAYNGEITFNVFNKSESSPDFDCPVYWSDSLGEWKTTDTCSAGGVSETELDLKGETLPEVAATGWENNDGSLVFIHPQTGEEITYPGTVSVPGVGEVSMRDLMAMGPEELNRIMSEFTAGAILERTGDPELNLYKMQQVMGLRGTSYPGFIVDTYRLFPSTGAAGGKDFPELQKDALESLTDFVAIPIFSPETSDFMFWFTIQKGRAASVLNFENTDYDMDRFGLESLGTYGSTFGVFMEYDGEWQMGSYRRGGGGQILGLDGDDPGIGNVDLVNQVLNASSEAEILDILDEVGIIFTYPSVVVFEAGQ